MATLQVDVVSAEASIFSGEAAFIALPGEAGDLGILPGHTPLISRIRPGTVKIVRADKSEQLVFVAGGVLEVQPNQLTVLADVAVRSSEMDRERAEAAKKAAETGISQAKDDKSLAEAHKALAAAIAQLKTLDYLRSHKNK